jgi:phosphorylcholine metabolism protein LicD
MIYDSSSIVHRNIIFDAIVRGNNFKQRVYDSSSIVHRNIIIDAINNGKNFEKYAYPAFVNFIDFIEKKNGKYVLSFGTLLGCIRDNKRILWDDDFDIFMFEKDMKIFNDQADFSFTHDKDIIYKISYGNHNYIITKNPYYFYQVWSVDISNNKIIHKTMDIFYEMYYRIYNLPYHTNVTTNIFNGRSYNIPSNFNNFLHRRYGNNYMNEYVCCNHLIASIYLDKNKDKYLIMSKDEYNSFC